MRQLNRWQSLLQLSGGILMVAGAGLYVAGIREVSCWLFLAGSVVFAAMQALQQYDGPSFVVRRLRRLMLLATMLFVLAGLVMAECTHGFIRPWFYAHVHNGSTAYITYIYNKWVVLLLAGTFLEVYTTLRISNELEKEAKKR